MWTMTQLLVPCAAAMMMPLREASINRLSPSEQNRIVITKNSYSQIATILESKVDTIRLTNNQIKNSIVLLFNLDKNSI